ncbi:protein translocase subunit SecF [Salinibius halmophilus]|uniref:protein translocase subunit SecF n=1 Tax=Salinibius halmophilus TaxID=1853216 RepID=UPI000E673F0A|nr:protein translocase subunit SecF [Salinibius halmophilus]
MNGKIIDFMQWRKIAGAASIALFVLSLVFLVVRGINFGLDFTGGALIEVEYVEAAPVQEIRQTLTEAGYRDVTVQLFGSETDVMIRFQADNDPDLGNKVVDLLTASGAELELLRNEFVGPSVGEELRDKGGLGLMLALAVVLVYVAFRFQFKFGIGAVAALIHDVVIIGGIFALFQLEFDLTVLAALLAVIGYSLNDTIVVSDRIRETFQESTETDVVKLINIALTDTLSRTLITSFTTALVLIALLIFGGQMLAGFAEALLIGVVVGTYSSIYVSSNILLATNLTRQDMIPPSREEPDLTEEKPSWLQDD